MSDIDVIHQDMVDILNALGLGDYARPISMHEIVQTEILPAIRNLKSNICGLNEEVRRVRMEAMDYRYGVLS